MGIVIAFRRRRHARASADTAGRGTSDGQGASGQFSENQRIVRSSRRTWMSAPPSMAASFLESLNARQLTVEGSRPSIAAYARATVSNCSVPVMPPISVSLPGKSTVNTPGEKVSESGRLTGMDLARTYELIKRRLAELGLKEHEAGKLARHPEVIRNIRRAVRDGRRYSPIARTWADLESALKLPPGSLLRSDSAQDLDSEYLRWKVDVLSQKVEQLEQAMVTLVPRRKTAP